MYWNQQEEKPQLKSNKANDSNTLSDTKYT